MIAEQGPHFIIKQGKNKTNTIKKKNQHNMNIQRDDKPKE